MEVLCDAIVRWADLRKRRTLYRGLILWRSVHGRDTNRTVENIALVTCLFLSSRTATARISIEPETPSSSDSSLLNVLLASRTTVQKTPRYSETERGDLFKETTATMPAQGSSSGSISTQIGEAIEDKDSLRLDLDNSVSLIPMHTMNWTVCCWSLWNA